MIYVIETNFYTAGGSKLNETSRSYKMIAEESKDITDVKFVWITDGGGWKSAARNLEETFQVMDTLYNIADMENGILKNYLQFKHRPRLSHFYETKVTEAMSSF